MKRFILLVAALLAVLMLVSSPCRAQLINIVLPPLDIDLDLQLSVQTDLLSFAKGLLTGPLEGTCLASDGLFKTWGLDIGLDLVVDIPCLAHVFLSTDINLGTVCPLCAINPAGIARPWNIINYILNHKLGTAAEIQAAIWFFTNPALFAEASVNLQFNRTIVDAIIADARINGVAFIPGPGQIVAVVVDALSVEARVQLPLVILELVVPIGQCVPVPSTCNACTARSGYYWCVDSNGKGVCKRESDKLLFPSCKKVTTCCENFHNNAAGCCLQSQCTWCAAQSACLQKGKWTNSFC